jgi:hypothetical protein
VSDKKWIPHPVTKWQVDWHALKYHKHAMGMSDANKIMSTPKEDGSHMNAIDFHEHLHNTGQFGLGQPHDHFTPKDKK